MRGMVNTVRVMAVVTLYLLLHVHTVMSAASPSSQEQSHDQDQEVVVISSVFAAPWNGSLAFMSRLASSEGKTRVKRQATYNNKDVTSFNAEEKKILTDKHNTLRKQEDSSNMMYMYWDKDVAAFAQNWVDQCDFKHSTNEQRKNIGTHSNIGENLYASSASYDPSRLVQDWYDEKKDYDFNTGQCSTQMCGHYTQVVWSGSFALGCGVRYCSDLKSAGFSPGFLVSCNYGPAGNYLNTPPYKKGKACSACGIATFCIEGLCATSAGGVDLGPSDSQSLNPTPTSAFSLTEGEGATKWTAKFPVVPSSDVLSRAPSVLVLIGCCAVTAMLSWMVM